MQDMRSIPYTKGFTTIKCLRVIKIFTSLAKYYDTYEFQKHTVIQLFFKYTPTYK